MQRVAELNRPHWQGTWDSPDGYGYRYYADRIPLEALADVLDGFAPSRAGGSSGGLPPGSPDRPWRSTGGR